MLNLFFVYNLTAQVGHSRRRFACQGQRFSHITLAESADPNIQLVPGLRVKRQAERAGERIFRADFGEVLPDSKHEAVPRDAEVVTVHEVLDT